MHDPTLDPYAVLKLPYGSSLDDIRKQYRRLARIYHPDRNPGDAAWCEEQIKELNAAFDLLSDPAKKSAYDALSQTGGAPARNGQPRTEQPRSAASNGFHDADHANRPPVAQSPVRRERRSILPLLGASLAGIAAIGALIFVKSSQVPTPSAPAAWTRHAPAPPVVKHSTPAIRHEAAGNAARHHRAASHSFHRKTVMTAHDESDRAVTHSHVVHSHILTAKQKDAIALRLAEAAEARRESRGHLKRISPQAMIRQMRNAARGL